MKIKMRSMMSCKLILLTLSPPSQLRRSWLGRERVNEYHVLNHLRPMPPNRLDRREDVHLPVEDHLFYAGVCFMYLKRMLFRVFAI